MSLENYSKHCTNIQLGRSSLLLPDLDTLHFESFESYGVSLFPVDGSQEQRSLLTSSLLLQYMAPFRFVPGTLGMQLVEAKMSENCARFMHGMGRIGKSW